MNHLTLQSEEVMPINSNVLANPYELPLRINVGGFSYVDSNDNHWMADQYFVGGRLYSTENDITGTENDYLYQTERYAKDLAYAIPIVDGTYTIHLSFAEIYFENPQARTFDLHIEDQLVLSDFGVFETAIGANQAITQSFQVEVEDGELNLDFLADINNAKLSAIEILPVVPEPEFISFDLQGQFSATGIVPGGYFEGSFTYDLNSPNIFPENSHLGMFKVSYFEIDIFDAEGSLVDSLTEDNFLANILLGDTDGLDGEADKFVLSTVPDTNSNKNAFFEHGNIVLAFEWLDGGSSGLAPEAPPQAFEQGFFSSFAAVNSYEGIFNSQSVESAAISFSPIEFSLQGQFTEEGFLAGGYFEGTFSYLPDAPDKNPNIINVGTFDVPDFEINVFNADGELVDSLTGENSIASVSLEDIEVIDGIADHYSFSTTPVSEANENAFFEFGEFEFDFDWVLGGSTDKAPTQSPQALENAYFSSFAAAGGYEGIINPQQIQSATIEKTGSGFGF